jgi:hypothetical protein
VLSPVSVTATRAARVRAAALVRGLPTAVLVLIAALLAWREEGSIAARDWTGHAVLAALVLAAVAASGAARLPARRLAAAAGLLVLLAGWDAVALFWSASPALGREESLLVVLYAVALLVPALSLRTEADRLTAAAAVAAGSGIVACLAAVELVRAPSAEAVAWSGRLAFPIGYPNAQAAFFLVALWPALALAADRRVALPLRGLAVGAAAALAGGWALAQSKGGALGLAASAVVVFAVSRRRLRLAVPFALVTALVAASFPALTEPYRAADRLAALHRAGAAELALAACGLLLGLVYAAVDARVVVAERTARRAGRVVVALLAAAVVAGCAAFFATHPHPGSFAAGKWSSFKHLPTHRDASTHLGSLGSNRYDFWRVAIHETAAHPLAGIGTRGFRAAYLGERRSSETPARAHSVELDVLSETGIVGFLLFAAALGTAIAASARRARTDTVALAALGTFTCWLVHASVDWTWSFPSIGVPVFLLLGAAAARREDARLPLRAAVPAALAAVALAAGAFGLPWLAAHYVREALDGRGNPAAALDTARSLDPISTDPLVAAASLAPTPRAAIAPLEKAVRMEPRSPDLLYALGRKQLLAGDRAAARSTLAHALRLDPGEPVIEQALADAR